MTKKMPFLYRGLKKANFCIGGLENCIVLEGQNFGHFRIRDLRFLYGENDNIYKRILKMQFSCIEGS